MIVSIASAQQKVGEMTFEDEARQIGEDFLYLIPGNLREKSRYILDNFGVRLPYSSYENQWSSLVSQLGIVDGVRKLLAQYMKVMTVDGERALRKATREPISQQEAESLNLWFLIDTETGRASNLGLFVLKHGTALSQELGRLSAVNVYHISACINWLLQVRASDKVVFEDRTAERHGDRSILGYLKYLERLLGECRLAPLEHERLQGLIDSFEKRYCEGEATALTYEDHPRLLRVLEKIEAVVSQGIVDKDFSELRPTSGVLDYRKLPSQVLDGLLGDVTYSMPSIVRQDLEEAIKCLRFGAPTASVMVGLRAVEGWLRELYFDLMGKKTKKPWAALLKDIQSLLSEKGVPTEPVTGFLNYVRDVRNTADHPDKTFSQVEAEQVFVAATTAIRELEKLK